MKIKAFTSPESWKSFNPINPGSDILNFQIPDKINAPQ
jgi:hypothetical protein